MNSLNIDEATARLPDGGEDSKYYMLSFLKGNKRPAGGTVVDKRIPGMLATYKPSKKSKGGADDFEDEDDLEQEKGKGPKKGKKSSSSVQADDDAAAE